MNIQFYINICNTLLPISAQHMHNSDFHKNRVRYNIDTTNKSNSKKIII